MDYYGSPSRESGFKKAAELFKANGGKCIVETGCAWNPPQGQSTLHLANLAKEVGGTFISIDLNPSHVAAASALINGDFPNARIICGDSLEVLSGVNHGIDLLYLDAFDYVTEQPDLVCIYNAAELGACLGKMSAHSVILLDDWNWGNGFGLKPAFSKQFLEFRGWKLVQADFQLLYAR